ncbi:MAG: hypothetical protein RLZZ553_798 [Verrucomicrobiota bacterium]|jgi:hypothetical protein
MQRSPGVGESSRHAFRVVHGPALAHPMGG